MQLINKKILSVLIGAAVTFVLLYLAPKTGPVEAKPGQADELAHGIESHMAGYKSGLSIENLALVEGIEAEIGVSQGNKKINLLDSLAKLWDDLKNPIASAIVLKQKAEASGSSTDLFESAEKHFYASRFAEGHENSHLIEEAIKAYENVLKREPGHIDAKIGLAVCLVEGSVEFMKGIGLLKEVLEKEPENIKALINLGYFSIKSNQYEKAIERFEKVIEIDPGYAESYLYLGDVYESLGDIGKAIANYNMYSERVNNPMLQQEINRYVEKLKTN